MSHPSDPHGVHATKMMNGGAAGNKFRSGQRQRMHLNDTRSQQPQQPQSLPPYPVSGFLLKGHYVSVHKSTILPPLPPG